MGCNRYVCVLALLFVLVGGFAIAEAAPGPPEAAVVVPAGMRAGLRASDYGISPFPSPAWWVDSINSMSGGFPGSTGSSIVIPVEIDGMSGPGCWAHFPNPDGGTYPGIRFDAEDEFEPMLAAFDTAGIDAWVQVESSGCSMSMLIDLVMRQYGSHPSVIGFGVDDEWYLNKQYQVGKPITDAEAQAWVQQVRTFNPEYQVFLKHWLVAQMPPTYREGLVFINDSQGFRSLTAMVNDFAAWGKHFVGSPVGFQYGYAKDRKWWRRLANPPVDIGNAILARTPNTMDLYWVDFTAYEIWPAQ